MNWHNKNYGLSPFDPDYIDDYDAEQDYDAYCEACEEREQEKMEKLWTTKRNTTRHWNEQGN